MDWSTYRAELRPRRRVQARRALTDHYAAVTVERLDLRGAVGTRLRTGPLYAVVPYKEAFSPGLVREVIDFAGVTSGTLLDPFVGAGTSLLAAAAAGLAAIGVDILPFSTFAARTLLQAPLLQWDTIDEHLPEILAHARSRQGRFPNFPVRDWAFGPAALGELSDLHTAIAARPDGRERDALRLALLCSVELMSQATKDGTSLRRRPHGGGRPGRFGTRRTRADVQAAFVAKLELLRSGAAHQPTAPVGSTAVTGDARDLPGVLGTDDGFDIAVFSPPYPNRYDYVSNYQLELGFGFVTDVGELRSLRKQQLRSHLEAPWAGDRTVQLAALDEFLAAYLSSDLRSKEAGRVFRMVCGYFEDMSEVLAGLHTVMSPGAVVAIVVGTQVFGGEQLPTDLLLAEIAVLHGFSVKEIWLARTKGMAVQQRKQTTKAVASRESVLLLVA
jgi:hypothetical protein